MNCVRLFACCLGATKVLGGLLSLSFVATPSAAVADKVLLFPYFDSNGENGTYLAWSDDGRIFHGVNANRPIFVPPRWEGQNLTRDPSIVLHDGLFHMVWTSNWRGNVFGYASSPDLKEWSTPQKIQPFPAEAEQPTNVWAPEIFRDPVAEDFKIVWSSTLPSELADGDGSEDSHGNDHRMFYVATRDFAQFSTPELLFEDRDYSVIDAHVAYDAEAGSEDAASEARGRWIMTLKKELPPDRDGKNIRLAFSPAKIEPESFTGAMPPVVGVGTPIGTGEFAEGPSLVNWRGEWLLYWDSYGARHYALAASRDLVSWVDLSRELKFPVPHPRHGSVFVADRFNVGWDLTVEPHVP